jgi:TolB-like protein/Flp pilus assembly protein TadD
MVNNAWAVGFLGGFSNLVDYLGDGQAGLRKAIRISPHDPMLWTWTQWSAIGHYFAHDYSAALEATDRVIRLRPDHHIGYCWKAAALAQLDRVEEAKKALQRAIAISPANVESYRHTPSRFRKRSADYARFLDGLRKASLPDEPSLALPDKPSIAVLPFQNMSGDSEQEYFADGMAEEILTALSRCKWLFVIARTSSFTYKNKVVDVRQVGRELGVRYVLEGSVRRGGNYLRFTAQLIDATSGAHIWADRFEGETSDVFALQDRITESVVGAIEPNLQRAEIERLKQKPATSLDAYDLLLRAHQLVYEFTPDSLTAALEYLKRSLAIDPHYAPAMAMTAYCYNLRRYQSWAKEIEAEAAQAIRLSLRAVELANDDANVLWMAGMAIWPLPGELRRGTDWVRRSLEINPNSAMALTVMGWIEAIGGNKEKALQLLMQARRLSPRDPSAWFTFGGLAIVYFRLARYEESVAAAETALSHNPRYAFALRFLAAGLVMLGRRERATEVAQLILKVEPGLTMAQLRARHPDNVDLQFVNAYWDALGAAGIPE